MTLNEVDVKYWNFLLVLSNGPAFDKSQFKVLALQVLKDSGRYLIMFQEQAILNINRKLPNGLLHS